MADRTPQFPGLGDRIRLRLRALEYWNAQTNRPDVMRFVRERQGYIPQLVYDWLKDRSPNYENLHRLAKDLGVSMGWLAFGDEATMATKAKSRPAGSNARRLRGTG